MIINFIDSQLDAASISLRYGVLGRLCSLLLYTYRSQPYFGSLDNYILTVLSTIAPKQRKEQPAASLSNAQPRSRAATDLTH